MITNVLLILSITVNLVSYYAYHKLIEDTKAQEKSTIKLQNEIKIMNMELMYAGNLDELKIDS